MVGMLLLVIVLNRVGSKDSSITVKAKKIWGRCACTETPGPLHPVNSVIVTLGTEALVANVESGMGRTAACADVVQCNVRFGGGSVR